MPEPVTPTLPPNVVFTSEQAAAYVALQHQRTALRARLINVVRIEAQDVEEGRQIRQRLAALEQIGRRQALSLRPVDPTEIAPLFVPPTCMQRTTHDDPSGPKGS